MAQEPGANFIDSASVVWTLTDDPANKRVDISAAASGGDYIFVTSQNETGAPGVVDFTNIPQDARHLVIECRDILVPGDLLLQLNADGGNHYRTIGHIVDDTNGVLLDTPYSTALVASIQIKGLGNNSAGTAGARAIIEIPYYRQTPTSGFGNRSLTVRGWIFDDEGVVHAFDRIAEVFLSGFWKYPNYPTLPVPAISRVTIFDAGFTGGLRASLYKIR